MNKALFSSASAEWTTPRDLFLELHARFHFMTDVAASDENHLCDKYFTKENDGLTQPWFGPCFMNPPYGREIARWVEKASLEALGGSLVVGLLPARTDTAWWQKFVAPYADIRFIKGRLKFGNAKNCAPFPSAIAIWWGFPKQGGWFE